MKEKIEFKCLYYILTDFLFKHIFEGLSREEHTAVPDFSGYRRPNSGVPEGDYSRRAFTYALTASACIVGAHTAKNVVQDFLQTMSASVMNGFMGKKSNDL
jgi:hypothetical protein